MRKILMLAATFFWSRDLTFKPKYLFPPMLMPTDLLTFKN
jgi:hypothetical protein